MRTFFTSVRLLLLALVLAVLLGPSVQAQTVVVPSSSTLTEGSGNNGFPFNIGDFGLSQQRYQQVYAASEFAGFSGPVTITQIAFRPDVAASAFSTSLSDIQINMS